MDNLYATLCATPMMCWVHTALCGAVVYYVMQGLLSWGRRVWKLRHIPRAPGGLPLFGQALTLATVTPWDIMTTWCVIRM